MTKRLFFSLVAGTLAIVLLLGRCQKTPSLEQSKLPAQTQERVMYDEVRHQVTLQTRTGTRSFFSHDSPAVNVQRNGTVIIRPSRCGLEHRAYWGIGFSDTLRCTIGGQFAYAYVFDAGVGVSLALLRSQKFLEPNLSLGWNFYRNTSLTATVNPLQFSTVGLYLVTRF